jgi:long-chain acyl-CoA synthetase
VPRGTPGELLTRGYCVMLKYWNDAERTATAIDEARWIASGDIAVVDDEGYFKIVGRIKDMLIRGGENIYCIEVENCLYEHPAVMDAGVVGIPHKTLGEEPAAVVTLKPGMTASEAELRAHVAERLAAFKVPVKVAFWHETLPRNANGKILKAELKKVFAAG